MLVGFMTELIVGLAILGSVVAGLWDLKTTEVPDEIPALMIAVGILYWFVSSVITGNSYPLLVSVFSSAIIGLAGYALYKTGKWGGADGFILAAIAAMIPLYNGRVFIVDYVMNLIIVSALYMVAYTAVLGFLNPGIFAHFFEDLKKNYLMVVLVPLAYFAVILLLGITNKFALLYGVIIAFLVLFYRYAVVIEKKVFRKRIAAAKLKPGDVLEKMIWRGLTKKEVREIRKKETYVVIKEGIRFVPAFAITLFVTLLYGNMFLAFVSL